MDSKREHTHHNLTMLTDFYELTMSNGYLANGKGDTVVYFDMFYRKKPDNGGFAIMAGLEQLIDYMKEITFTEEDIEYFRTLKIFDEIFLEYLRNFRFSCDVWAVPEGTPIFPHEPIVTVRGPIIQAQFIETMVLLAINHQSLIATKANRISRAAEGRAISEFGARRAQGYDASIYGARAAIIGGCSSTSCTIAGRDFGIPVSGTMAHSWIQFFGDELEAFKTYARQYPDSCTLLIDTYNVMKSGLPNAIRAFDEELKPLGKRPVGVRIDSGDITYLSKKIRARLDEAGYPDCKIVASNSLDENIIRDMLIQGAKVDCFGVGERLITAASDPVFGGVYKMSGVEDEFGNIHPRIKISENIEKLTIPCFKSVYRLFDRDSGKAIADVITLHDETIDDTKPYEIFDPDHTWKRKTVTNFIAKPLREKIFDNGECIYKSPDIMSIQKYCREQVSTLWDEVLRFENPHKYYVDLSPKLWNERQKLLSEFTKK